MASSLNSCIGEKNVSFPLRTSIKNLETYYKSIEQQKPNIRAQYTARATNPNFSSETRLTGEIDESLNSISVFYNNIEYQLLNVQITMATHTDWLINNDPSKPIQNKIDFIVTLETTREGNQPRYVILVVPLVLDDSTTTNNPYLAGLAYLTNDSVYSLSTIFNNLNNYIFYTTCLAPHGDKAFVYVNTDTIKINNDLYTNLLAVWTQQSLSSVQTRILDNLTPVQKSLSKLFQNLQNAKNLQEIQQQINNIQATAQNPVINSMVETWPRYSPPYDVVLNVPSTTIDQINVESFQNYSEAFQDVASTGSGGLGAGTTESNEATSTTTPRERLTGELKCVPLDLDDAVDSSGKLQFDGNGNLALGQIEATRQKIRSNYESNQLSYQDIIKYLAPTLAVFIVLGILYFLVWPLLSTKVYPDVTLPEGPPGQGAFIIYSLIFIFAGFLVGAAVAKAY